MFSVGRSVVATVFAKYGVCDVEFASVVDGLSSCNSCSSLATLRNIWVVCSSSDSNFICRLVGIFSESFMPFSNHDIFNFCDIVESYS